MARPILRGTRLHAKVPYGHCKTLTFRSGASVGTDRRPCVFDRLNNATSFLAWVKKALVPTLAPRGVVVMDKLRSYKNAAVRATIRAAGAKLFVLPAYSPDLNSIKHVFSKWKTLLRKAAEGRWKRPGRGSAAYSAEFKPDKCGNYLTTVGYIGSV